MAEPAPEADASPAAASRPFVRTTAFAYALAAGVYVALFLALLVLFVL